MSEDGQVGAVDLPVRGRGRDDRQARGVANLEGGQVEGNAFLRFRIQPVQPETKGNGQVRRLQAPIRTMPFRTARDVAVLGPRVTRVPQAVGVRVGLVRVRRLRAVELRPLRGS